MTTNSRPFASVEVAGIPFGVTTADNAVSWLIESVCEGTPAVAVRLANAYCVTSAYHHPEYSRLLKGRGINLPDGASVTRAMRLLSPVHAARSHRVRGPSFFTSTLSASVGRGVSHYFIGATGPTLAKLTQNLQDRIHGLNVVGTYAPPFGPINSSLLDDLVERARHSGADIVWVGMGTPKQDFVAEAIASRAGIHAVGVGAAFDFQAGTLLEAPRWVQRAGMEWLFRFAMEPRRLWRRYTGHNLLFIMLIGKQLMRRLS